MDIIDRILRAVGLIRTARAKHIAIEITAMRERTIVEYVYQDFKVPPKIGFEEYIRGWTAEAFDQANKTVTTKKELLVTEDEEKQFLQDKQKVDIFLARYKNN